ncbi:MAG: colicin import membrane protein, partial [Thalassolituus oleivorans]
QRLSAPVGNNALEKIEAFRGDAPFDFRVVPLTYRWGESYVELANRAIAGGQFDKAQGYLDKVWPVASLTPGLEEAQRVIDDAIASGMAKPAAVAAVSAPTKAELEHQRQLAEAAEKEKQRLQADYQRKKQEEQKAAEEKARKELAEQQRQQQLERERRAANEQKLKEQRLAQQTAKAKAASAPAKVAVDDIEDELLNTKPKSAPVKAAAKVAPVVAPKAAAKPTVTTLASAASVAAAWADAKEDSEPIARYDIPTEDLANRSRDIADNMNGACQAMVDNDASVVIHAADKSDYRWLAVRLTLCTRRIDRSYRLRHSHEVLSGGAPFLTLHPARDTALIRQ